MTKRIPIEAAKRIAKEYGQSQVILLSWEGDTGVTHCVTYGTSKKHCEQAAQGGNLIKRFLNERGAGFTEEQCTAVPSRINRKGTKTGRFECKEPNVSNEPKGKLDIEKLIGLSHRREI